MQLKPLRLQRQVRAIERVVHQLEHDPPNIPLHWRGWFTGAYSDLLRFARAAADLEASDQLSRASAGNFSFAVRKGLSVALEIWYAPEPRDRRDISEKLIEAGRRAREILLTAVAGAAEQRKQARLVGPVTRRAPADPICIDNSFWHDPEWLVSRETSSTLTGPCSENK